MVHMLRSTAIKLYKNVPGCEQNKVRKGRKTLCVDGVLIVSSMNQGLQAEQDQTSYRNLRAERVPHQGRALLEVLPSHLNTQ